MLNLEGFLQLTANGLINGLLYALVGWAFALILNVTGRFHLAFAFTYALSAMVAAGLGSALGIPWVVSIVVGAVVGGVAGALIEWGVYRRIAARAPGDVLLAVFVAALAIQIGGTNLLSLVWLGQSSLQIRGFQDGAVGLGSVTLSLSSTTSAAIALGALLLAWLVMSKTRWGRITRGVSANIEMSQAVGIDPRRIFVGVFAVGSFAAGIAAVLDATSTAATSSMGAKPLFFAFIVAFVSRSVSVPGAAAVGLALGLIESWTGLFVPAAWSGAVVFALLLIYVALRPYDLRRLIAAMNGRGTEASRAVSS